MLTSIWDCQTKFCEKLRAPQSHWWWKSVFSLLLTGCLWGFLQILWSYAHNFAATGNAILLCAIRQIWISLQPYWYDINWLKWSHSIGHMVKQSRFWLEGCSLAYFSLLHQDTDIFSACTEGLGAHSWLGGSCRVLEWQNYESWACRGEVDRAREWSDWALGWAFSSKWEVSSRLLSFTGIWWALACFGELILKSKSIR